MTDFDPLLPGGFFVPALEPAGAEITARWSHVQRSPEP
jgi:hypothetical protein